MVKANTLSIFAILLSLVSLSANVVSLSGVSFNGSSVDLMNSTLFNGTILNYTYSENKTIFESRLTSNYTWVNITGLDIRRDMSYLLELNIFTYEVGGTVVNLYINNDINNSNYTRQFVYADGVSMISARDNDPGVIGTQQNWGSSAVESIYLDAQGRGHYVSQASLNVPAGVVFFNGQYTHNFFQNNITTLNLKATTVNGIGKGSEIILTKP